MDSAASGRFWDAERHDRLRIARARRSRWTISPHCYLPENPRLIRRSSAYPGNIAAADVSVSGSHETRPLIKGRGDVSRRPTRRGHRPGLLLPGIGKVDSQQAVAHQVVLVSIQEHDAFSFEQSACVPVQVGGLLQDG